MFDSIRSLLSRLGAGRRAPADAQPPAVAHDDDGLTIRPSAGQPTCIRWAEVNRAVVMRVDRGAGELIALQFELTSGCTVHIDEESEGWVELADSLPRRLLGCRRLDDWWKELSDPAGPRDLPIYHRPS